MASISNYTVNVMRGVPAEPQTALETVERPGANGSELLALGKREMPTEIYTLTADTKANALAMKINHEKLRGTVVALIDAFGTTHSAVAVEAVRATVRPAAIVAGNATATHVVESVFTVRKRVTSP
ncbi:MAG TPA: hypothetical protein VLL76_01570 [Candidatus Omnitrophota bacterium]|nr:hypothetical protein [Candidatus Omnitrophota bacterium]